MVRIDTADWRLPRETGNLIGDLLAADRARQTATTDAQRAAVTLRMVSLHARSEALLRPMREAAEGFAAALRPAFADVERAWAEMAREMFPGLARVERQRQEYGDAWSRALEARQHRNAGPVARSRPPRRIDGPGAWS